MIWEFPCKVRVLQSTNAIYLPFRGLHWPLLGCPTYAAARCCPLICSRRATPRAIAEQGSWVGHPQKREKSMDPICGHTLIILDLQKSLCVVVSPARFALRIANAYQAENKDTANTPPICSPQLPRLGFSWQPDQRPVKQGKAFDISRAVWRWKQQHPADLCSRTNSLTDQLSPFPWRISQMVGQTMQKSG